MQTDYVVKVQNPIYLLVITFCFKQIKMWMQIINIMLTDMQLHIRGI